LEIKDHAIPAN